MEPRSTLHSTVVLRQDSALAQERPNTTITHQRPHTLLDPPTQRYFPEPQVPIHPALEYEVYADEEDDENDDDDDDDDGTSLDGPTAGDDPEWIEHRRRRKQRRRIKRLCLLMLSSAGLIVSGVGKVVSAKIQAIPMYVASQPQ